MRTVIGLFDNEGEARRAVVELVDAGIPREDIGVTSQQYGEGSGYSEGSGGGDSRKHDEGIGDKIGNFFDSLFGGDSESDARYYSDAVGRGGTVVTVDAETEEVADRVSAILNRFDADVDEQGADSGERHAAYDTNAAAGTSGAGRAEMREGAEARLPVIEEELQVGKRRVEGGGVRVRSRVIERPVEEAVRLREERVNVDRRPVNRAVTDEDLNAFREGTFEVREHSEEAVVNKQARVVEEVAINKETGERTETVRDTLRKTDVEVEEVDAQRTKGKGARGGR